MHGNNLHFVKIFVLMRSHAYGKGFQSFNYLACKDVFVIRTELIAHICKVGNVIRNERIERMRNEA